MEKILEKENMESAKALAQANVKISEAKNILFKLQEEETEYLEQREVKALGKIQKALDDSKDLVKQIKENNKEVHEFCSIISEYAMSLSEAHDKFQNMIELFHTKNELWDKNIKKQQSDLAGIRKIVEKDKEDIENQKQDIKKREKRLSEQLELIESRQKTLAASYKAEKDLWNKINSK